jgi:hypothetical protein
MPQRYDVRVVLDATVEQVAELVGRWGRASGTDGRAVLEMHVDSLDWPLLLLANTHADFAIESPPELADAVTRVAARFTRSTGTWSRLTPMGE